MSDVTASAPSPVNWLKLPWLLLWLLPALSVVAGLTTVYIAVLHGDSMVKDDYYRQGLAYNSQQAADQQAARLRLQAMLLIVDGQLLVTLSAEQLPALPDTLNLHLSHPTDSQADTVLSLVRQQGNQFQSREMPAIATNWHVQLAPADDSWRLRGRWQPPAPVQLKPEVY